MNSQQKKLIIFAILALLTLLAVIVGSYISQHTGFRVVSRDPSGDVPLSVTQISFTTNEKITNQDAVELTIEPSVSGAFTIADKTVTFTPEDAFQENEQYTLTIRNARVASDSKSHHTKETFTAAYVPYDKLSDAEKARQLQRTNPVQQKYPVTRDLPYVTSTYKMEYTPPFKKDDPIIIRITPLISQSRGESTEQYQTRLLTIKDEVETYLTDKGHDPSTYYTYYQDIFLLQYSTANHAD
jgi:hypothetical protein